MDIQTTGVVPAWTVGDRLRKARSLTGMTTREFAQHIGASQKTVTDAEGDRRTPRKMLLNAWALATGVPPEWLATGTALASGGPMPPSGSSETGDELLELTERSRSRARNSATRVYLAAA